MLKKKVTALILTLTVAVAIPCTAFAGELDADTATTVPTASMEKNSSDVASPASTEEGTSQADNNQQISDTTEPTLDEHGAGEVASTEEIGTQEAIVVEILDEPVPLEEVVEILDEPVSLEEVAEIISESVPLEDVPEIISEIPVESTLLIHHLFQYDDIVCDEYETITGLTAGGSICVGEYNYEEDYIFADCLNADEMVTLAEGENEVVLYYTLKEGFRIAE